MSEKEYYVYEYIRLDYNEPFYIGKGKGNRWKNLSHRSPYFKNLIKNIPVACIILNENLTENEANEIESWYIWKLRDVEGYPLINLTDGGEGISGYKHSNNFKKDQSERFTGENNPMFGKKLSSTEKQQLGTWWTPERKEQFSSYLKESFKGKNNPRAKSTVIVQNKNIILSFDTVGDLQTYMKDKYNISGRTIIRRLQEGGEIKGLYLYYKNEWEEKFKNENI